MIGVGEQGGAVTKSADLTFFAIRSNHLLPATSNEYYFSGVIMRSACVLWDESRAKCPVKYLSKSPKNSGGDGG